MSVLNSNFAYLESGSHNPKLLATFHAQYLSLLQEMLRDPTIETHLDPKQWYIFKQVINMYKHVQRVYFDVAYITDYGDLGVVRVLNIFGEKPIGRR